MASINGVALKSVKEFIGHDGPGYYCGNVYLNNKKLGGWTQDAWCGPDNFMFDETELENIAKDVAKTDFVEDEYKDIYDAACLVGDVLDLWFLEQEFKKTKTQKSKKGYNSIVLIKYGRSDDVYFCNLKDKKDASTTLSEQISDIKKKYKVPDDKIKLEVYMDLSDFDITV